MTDMTAVNSHMQRSLHRPPHQPQTGEDADGSQLIDGVSRPHQTHYVFKPHTNTNTAAAAHHYHYHHELVVDADSSKAGRGRWLANTRNHACVV